MTNRLHEAASAGDIAQIRELITKQNYNPNQWNEENAPPLAFAAAAGQLEAMKELVRLGANLQRDRTIKERFFYNLLIRSFLLADKLGKHSACFYSNKRKACLQASLA